MTFVDAKIPFGIGELDNYQLNNSSPTSSSGYRINSTGTAAGLYDSGIFSLEKDGVITEVGFYVVSIVGTGTYSASLVTTNSVGVPTSIDYGGSSGTVLLHGEISTGWNWITLSQPGTGSSGDLIAVKLQAVIADASNYLGMPTIGITIDTYVPGRYGSLSGGAGIQQTRPLFAYKYNDNHVSGYPIILGYQNLYTSGSSTNYHGMKFSVPVDVKCNGIRFSMSPFAINSKSTLLLYDSVDTILFQKEVTVGSPSHYSSISEIMFDEIELAKNVDYRFVLRSDKNVNVASRGVTFTTGTYRYTLPNGEYCMKTYRTGTTGYTFGSAWVDDDSSIPYTAVLINKVDDGATTPGGGGNTGTSNYYGWAS